MKIEKLLSIIDELGLRIRVGDQGQAILVVPEGWTEEDKAKAVTKPLLEALKLHKAELLEKLCGVSQEKRIECRWANDFIGRHWFPASEWPVGAKSWRYVGEEAWRDIPGGEEGKPQA